MNAVNTYFDGKVLSISFANGEGTATVGVMAPGEYEFGTGKKEIMQVVSGSMRVLLPGETEWKVFRASDTFTVPPDSRFKLEISEDCAYKCLYV